MCIAWCPVKHVQVVYKHWCLAVAHLNPLDHASRGSDKGRRRAGCAMEPVHRFFSPLVKLVLYNRSDVNARLSATDRGEATGLPAWLQSESSSWVVPSCFRCGEKFTPNNVDGMHSIRVPVRSAVLVLTGSNAGSTFYSKTVFFYFISIKPPTNVRQTFNSKIKCVKWKTKSSWHRESCT